MGGAGKERKQKEERQELSPEVLERRQFISFVLLPTFRNKPLKFKGGDSQDGLITPPQSYDQLSLDERRFVKEHLIR